MNLRELPDGSLDNVCDVVPDMIWATAVEDKKIRLYINEEDTLTFDRESAEAIVKALKGVLGAEI